MKLPWLSALVVLGVALAVRAKEEESDHLQDIHEGRQIDTAVTDVVNDVNNAVADVSNTVFPNGNPFLLALGNLFAALNLGELIDLTGGATAAGGVAAAGGAAAAAGGAAATALAAASTIKSAVLSLLLAPLDLANGILAIIALVLLIVYLVETEGDIKGLVGGNEFLRREYDDTYDSYSNYAVSTARALWNAPIIQRLTTDVHDALIKKY